MQKVVLYAHGGSANHGCEAIVRSMIKYLNLSRYNLLLSNNPYEDKKYRLDKKLDIRNARSEVLDNLIYKIRAKLSRNPDKYYYKQLYRHLSDMIKGYDVAYSIGGDNYCYRGMDLEMMVMRQLIKKTGVKTVLMGCSVEPESLSYEILNDLKLYDLIYCRESLTYNSLINYGFTKLKLLPDTAFILDRKDMALPAGFIEGNTVGINVSPLVIQKSQNKEIVMKNFISLIKFILKETNMNVALIPHVVWSHNDDRIPLRKLFEMFKETNRIVFIEDHDAEELKGFIARCRFLVAARTHATIAAYSSSVPTLVIGYSIKSRGIAKDLFGTEQDYVLPVGNMINEDDLKESFIWLLEHEEQTLQIYKNKLLGYISPLLFDR